MVDLNTRDERNKLRGIVISAEQNEVMTKEEAGFVLTLVDRFRQDIVKKEREALILQGQIAQLKINEQIIVQLIEGLVSAAERDIARRETAQKLREARDIQEDRRAAIKQRLNEAVEEDVIELKDESTATEKSAE
jgi:hypothetical protein